MNIPIKRQIKQFLLKLPIKDLKYCCELLSSNNIDYTLEQLESHCFGGGNIKDLCYVIENLVKKKINFKLWDLMVIQLSGRDMKEITEIYINHNNDPNVDIKHLIYRNQESNLTNGSN